MTLHHNDLNQPAPMLAVTDGRQTIGFIINRGKIGVEAFDADEQPLGLFKDTVDAATACWRHAHNQPSAETMR
jgi:hypothetical protein